MKSHRNGRGGIRSIVLDSQPLWQRTLEFMLRRKGINVVAVCSTASQLAESAALRPHLVVGDPQTVNGFAAHVRDLQAASPTLATIVVTALEDPGSKRELIDVGAIGFVPKHHELEMIEAEIVTLIDAMFPLESQLTERELEVLALVAEGRTNREVARLLWLSDQTVKFHLANVYRKLGVSSRGEAVLRARAEGILHLEEVHEKGGDNEDLAPAVLI